MNIKDYYPVVVIPAIASDKSITFNHLLEKVVVEEDISLIWQILDNCNGYNSIESIIDLVAESGTQVSIENTILDLLDLGIIVDSRNAYKHFNKLTNNPGIYNTHISFKEIKNHVEQRSKELGLNSRKIPADNLLQALMLDRFSCRSFDKGFAIDKKILSRIVSTAYSLQGASVPSAGGLYPLNIRVIVNRPGKEIKFGIYELKPTGLLNYIDSSITTQECEYVFDSDSLLFGASAIVVISGDFSIQSYKYSNRGYRYTILEAGHVAQNIHLLAAQEALSSLEYGGFQDELLKSLLDLPQHIDPIITIGLGQHSKDDAYNSYYLLERLSSEYVGRNKPINRVFNASSKENAHQEFFMTALAHFKPAKCQDAKKSYGERYSSGTARSYNHAMVKAIAEGYERYCSGRYRYDIESAAIQLEQAWADPRLFVPYSSEQKALQPWLDEFSIHKNIQWIEGQNLSTNENIYVPVDLVFYPLHQKVLGRKLIYEANSSGVAAHTSYEDAILSALLELIERDSIMSSWITKKPPAQLLHDSLPLFWQKRCRYWDKHGRKVYVLDHSHDGVNIINVCIVSKNNYPAFVNGSSASINSLENALDKAFQEAEVGLVMELQSGIRRRKLLPERVFSPSDHAKYYYDFDNFNKLDWLFCGKSKQCDYTTATDIRNLIEKYRPIVVNLSQEATLLRVVRLLSSELIPINFGFNSEHITHHTLDEVVELSEFSSPHYFA